MADDSTRVKVLLPNHAVIHVETTQLEQQDDADVAARTVEEVLEIQGVQEAIEGIGRIVVGALDKLGARKASAEFGIEVGLESGQLTALWVKGTGKANLKVTLEWSKD